MEKLAKGIEYFLFYYITAWFADTVDPNSYVVQLYAFAKDIFDYAVTLLATSISTISGLPLIYSYFLIFATITYILIRVLGHYLSRILIFAWGLVGVAIVVKLAILPLLR